MTNAANGDDGSCSIRPGTAADLESIRGIYNHYIVDTTLTYDTVPFSLSDMHNWFSMFATHGRFRLFVADRGAHTVGYCFSSAFKPKPAYDRSVNTTVYISPDATACGFGTALYEALFGALATEHVHRACAWISLPNEASVSLHTRFGFQQIAVLHEIGWKFGQYWNVGLFEKRFS